MLLSRLSLWASPALLASAALGKPTTFNTINANHAGQQIEWGPCNFKDSDQMQCANISVPLDYTDPQSPERYILELARSAAIKAPSRGSILVNFGGPGGNDIDTLTRSAETLHRNTGGYHDLIAFRTRGTGESLLFSCYDTPCQRELELSKYPRGDFKMDPSHWEYLDALVAQAWANKQVFANRCRTRNKDNNIGGLVGTTFVARDMIEIVDALGEDGLLRYWGFSYGTILGATVVALFPDRAERVVLDSVVSAVSYYDTVPLYPDQDVLEDATWDALLSECLDAGQDLCLLAADVDSNLTSRQEQIEALSFQIDSLWARIELSPLVVDETIILESSLHQLLDRFLKAESLDLVRRFVVLVHQLLNNQTIEAAASFANFPAERPPRTHDAHDAIWCGDRSGSNIYARPDSPGEVIREAKRIGESAGKLRGVEFLQDVVSCVKWPFESKESFNTSLLQVDGGLRTKYPILLFSNTYDVITPIHHARDLNNLLAGSVLVEQRGIGHGTIGTGISECTRSAYESYFLNGTLPEPGTVCKLDKSIFSK